MRWSDGYLGLLAATAGLGALVTRVAEGPWYGSGAFLLLGTAALAGMLWRSRRTPRVLFVSEPRGHPLYRLREALDKAGLGMRACPGPAARTCPVLRGEPCPIRGHPAVALIYRGGDEGPIPPCGRGLDIPVLTVKPEAKTSLRDSGKVVEPVRRQGEVVAVVRALVRGTVGEA